MKPRTAFQRRITEAGNRLKPLSEAREQWARQKIAPHFSFRTKGHINVCSECGAKFREKQVFSTLEVVDGMQVQRIYVLHSQYRRGYKAEHEAVEIIRRWYDEKGCSAVEARCRRMGYYVDEFLYSSPIELKKDCYVYQTLANSYVAVGARILPYFRQRGIKGRFPDVSPDKLFRGLYADPRIETVLKSGNVKDLAYFLDHITELDKIWNSYKIARRNGYRIPDISLWADLVQTLEACGRDIHNAHYVCPGNLKEAHDYWTRRRAQILEKERSRKQLEKAMRSEADFIRLKSKFFDLTISDGTIEIVVLDSIRAFKEEGETMHHCVFSNSYYDRPDSLVMSARIEGKRIETIELSLTDMKILQSRAVCNGTSEYHDRIINLVNANLAQIARRNTASCRIAFCGIRPIQFYTWPVLSGYAPFYKIGAFQSGPLSIYIPGTGKSGNTYFTRHIPFLDSRSFGWPTSPGLFYREVKSVRQQSRPGLPVTSENLSPAERIFVSALPICRPSASYCSKINPRRPERPGRKGKLKLKHIGYEQQTQQGTGTCKAGRSGSQLLQLRPQAVCGSHPDNAPHIAAVAVAAHQGMCQGYRRRENRTR